jgi:hypothetical protein
MQNTSGNPPVDAVEVPPRVRQKAFLDATRSYRVALAEQITRLDLDIWELIPQEVMRALDGAGISSAAVTVSGSLAWNVELPDGGHVTLEVRAPVTTGRTTVVRFPGALTEGDSRDVTTLYDGFDLDNAAASIAVAIDSCHPDRQP